MYIELTRVQRLAVPFSLCYSEQDKEMHGARLQSALHEIGIRSRRSKAEQIAVPAWWSTLILSPMRAVPECTLPVATFPKWSSCSTIATSIENGASGFPAGGGTCWMMTSSSGPMPSFSSAAWPSGGSFLDAQPCRFMHAVRHVTWEGEGS